MSIEFPFETFHSADPKVISSGSEIKSFKETSIYRDFISEISYRIKELQGILEDADMDYSGRHYDVFRGGIKFGKQMLTIFDDLEHEASNREIEEQ